MAYTLAGWLALVRGTCGTKRAIPGSSLKWYSSPTSGVWRAAPTVAGVVDTPDRKLAEAVRTNRRMAPLVGQVLELLQPYTDAHPKVVVRHVEELDSVTLPDGSRHQHGFVAITSVGLVVVWRSGVLRKRRGEHEVLRRDATGWELSDDRLLIDTASKMGDNN